MKKYKIVYYVGESIDLKTKFESGYAWLTDDALVIQGKSGLEIPLKNIKATEMFRQYGLGRMLKIHTLDQIVYLTVVRFNLFGYFVTVNFLRTGELNKLLNAAIA